MFLHFQITQLPQSLICVFIYASNNSPKNKIKIVISVYVSVYVYLCHTILHIMLCKYSFDKNLHMNRLYGSTMLAYMWYASSLIKTSYIWTTSIFPFSAFACCSSTCCSSLIVLHTLALLHKYILWSTSHWYPKNFQSLSSRYLRYWSL